MAKVQVLGTGCTKCSYLMKNAEAAAAERQAPVARFPRLCHTMSIQLEIDAN